MLKFAPFIFLPAIFATFNMRQRKIFTVYLLYLFDFPSNRKCILTRVFLICIVASVQNNETHPRIFVPISFSTSFCCYEFFIGLVKEKNVILFSSLHLMKNFDGESELSSFYRFLTHEINAILTKSQFYVRWLFCKKILPWFIWIIKKASGKMNAQESP